MSICRIIGDVHGHHLTYKKLINDIDYSIQVGDFGFSDSWDWLKTNVNSGRHKILPGNHDEYPKITNHSLGDCGTYNLGGMKFFFVRGAFSIDKTVRTENVNWWVDEELSLDSLIDALNMYRKIKPEIVITHDCPGTVYGVSTALFNRPWIPNRTSQVLQEMFDCHQPKLWIFGHWHILKHIYIKNTFFICLDELNFVNYDTEKNIDENIFDMHNYLKIEKRKSK